MSPERERYRKMPRRTRRSTSKRKSRKQPETPDSGESSLRESPASISSPKRPKLGSANGSNVVVSTPVLPTRIVGSRLSGVKHSGLLATDQEKRSASESDFVATTPLPKNLSPSSLVADDDTKHSNKQTMSGKQMYSFISKTQLGKKGLTPKLKLKEADSLVEECALTPKTQVVSNGSDSSRTTKKSKKDDSDDSLSDVEEMEVDEKTTKEKTTTTPGRVTRRSKKVVSESESDVSDLSDDEELAVLTAKLNRGEVVGDIGENVLEDYFTAHSSKTGLTSDHKLSNLACPKMDQHMVQSALKTTSSSYQSDYQSLYEEYTDMFPYWSHLMSNGYNVLLYGLGSKQQLLEDFRKLHLKDSCHLVVNGFFPGLTTKQVLTTLSSDLLGHSGSFKSLLEQASFICSELEQRNVSTPKRGPPKKVFLIIHNIDGPMLRAESFQTALSVLAQSPSVHILASIDHINAPLNWDQRKLSRYNWLWHDVTTFELYRDETSYENSLLVQHSGSLALSSLTHVTKSLTPNARGIFELLVKYQLEHKNDKESVYLGLSFHECYVKCREKFLVNSDMTLRAQLTEFRDHKLVRSRKGHDGVEYLFIPIDIGTLSQFLEQKNE